METTNDTVRLHGVSLGPGDPELVTLGALRVLEQADAVWYPATSADGGGDKSVALDILVSCGLDRRKFRAIGIPMSRNREKAAEAYDRHWKSMREEVRKGRSLAVVTVGDAGFYSTVTPFLQRAAEEGVPFSVVAGVPAFLAAGAAAGIPVASNDESVRVLAMVGGTDEIERALGDGGTVVVMKLSTVRDELVSWLEKSGTAFLYAEKVGMEGEFVTSDIGRLRRRDIPYFSLLICSRHCLSRPGAEGGGIS